ncbi:MAG: TIGR00730 family Rossman fold protein [Desulfobacteraceae bacterium]|nr:MAG: TIGR00730 family Rossman fold protein [Desulfobacteraceae bacterium]
MILTSLKAGQEDTGGVNLKLMNTSLKEMRYGAKVFGAYPGMKKVSVFGSARTGPDQPPYKTAFELGRRLAEKGYMVITGGGAGIMQAVNEGAGSEHSFGISIRLPFEQANPVILGSPRSVNYKYFFNRKVAFIKESDAVVLFPGGFGTLDEAMELLTLVQTGKRNPLPILLAEEQGGSYWSDWIGFVRETVLSKGYISEPDMRLFQRVESVDEAVQAIDLFYRRYHSLRYVGSDLVIRLNSSIEKSRVEELQNLFSDILSPQGDVCCSGPLDVEMDEPEISHLSRLVVKFNRRDFARLKEFIDAVNRD